MGASNENLNILIMAGGSGTRFWPKSRLKKPKQLLKLWDEKTLIEHTVERFLKIVSPEQIWIVTTGILKNDTRKILNKISKKIKILAEPSAKNTSACILWGTREIQKKNKNAVVAVMPADHYIRDEKAFTDAIVFVSKEAQTRSGIFTIGIKPNKPETGFGYIEVQAEISGSQKIVPVARFVEKPTLAKAGEYLRSGNYLWNGGMFLFQGAYGLKMFEKCMPSLVSAFEKNNSVKKTYAKITAQDSISFDYGIMERAAENGFSTYVFPLDCGWNDVGSFVALEEINCATSGESISIDSSANIIQSDKGLVALLGVNNLVVVRDGDVVMVADKSRCQDVKLILDKLKEKKSKLI